jgi:uncharacterized protein YjbI with pentapeptide repeats
VLSSSELRGADFSRVAAEGVNFRNANLEGAVLASGVFDRASVRSAELSGASLADSSFDGADFRGAELTRTTLNGADLSRAHGLTQDQLDEACADSRTRLPPGLTGRSCNGFRFIYRKESAQPHVRIVPAVRPPAPPRPPR